MRWVWTRVRAFDSIVLALKAQSTGTTPERMDDLHRFFQCLDRLAPAASWPSHSLNTFAKRSRTQAKLHTSTAEDIQGGSGFGQHGGRTQWQIRDIGEDMHSLYCLEQRGNQG